MEEQQSSDASYPCRIYIYNSSPLSALLPSSCAASGLRDVVLIKSPRCSLIKLPVNGPAPSFPPGALQDGSLRKRLQIYSSLLQSGLLLLSPHVLRALIWTCILGTLNYSHLCSCSDFDLQLLLRVCSSHSNKQFCAPLFTWHQWRR